MTAATRRSRFLAATNAKIEKGELPGIHEVKWTGDGFDIAFAHENLGTQQTIQIRVLCEDEIYLAYTDCEVPFAIANVLERMASRTQGMALDSMLNYLAGQLRSAIRGDTREDDLKVTEADDLNIEDDTTSEDDFDFEYGDHYDDDALFGGPDRSTPGSMSEATYQIPIALMARIRRDFEVLRLGGFKVGIVCGFTEIASDSIVAASVRVDKLHFPDDILEAWGLKQDEFIVLLIRYKDHPYTTFENATGSSQRVDNIDFRLRKCSKHKPTLAQAQSAFAQRKSNRLDSTASTATRNEEDSHLSHLCVGDSIDAFMDKDFINIVRLRFHEYKWDIYGEHGWTLAKSQVSLPIVTPARESSTSVQYMAHVTASDLEGRGGLPGFLQQDHINSTGQKSLALVAAQFAIRHFIDCTKYCLICQNRLDESFESLKPYVCGRPLCLFQYMTLGFGPSVEHEVLHQPYVVDLLISFCCFSLAEDSLGKIGMREVPTGLALKVPRISHRRIMDVPISSAPNSNVAPIPRSTPAFSLPLEGTFHWTTSTVTVPEWTDAAKFQPGQLVIVATPFGSVPAPEVPDLGVPASGTFVVESNMIIHHARVLQVAVDKIYLQIVVRQTLPLSTSLDENNIPQDFIETPSKASIILYDQNMDCLDPADQRSSMLLLLSTLPSVSDMRSHLLSSPNGQLEGWHRIVPSAFALLRWIIASNRSCIMSIGITAEHTQDSLDSVTKASGTPDPRQITGLNGWLQFRFAQGSPEHEARFQKELRQVSKPHKSLIAWHGSSLKNWHSIIRQGLNYAEIHNGRSYGNGVYFGKDLTTSLLYSSAQHGSRRSPTSYTGWQNSLLEISQAVSLVELVNVPEKFQSTTPHFVVQNCDWIQCRYLFVRVSQSVAATLQGPSPQISDEFLQDPNHRITGSGHAKLHIPRLAIDSTCSRTQDSELTLRRQSEQGHIDDSGLVFDLFEDVLLQAHPAGDENDRSVTIPTETDILNDVATINILLTTTDFRPGLLEMSSLNLLAPPSYATSSGTTMLGRELKKLQKVQQTTRSQMLGWYIDFDQMSNMYQWIVELHSFDRNLPLALDMEKAGVTSVVLEMRFGRDYPHSPPFVRVVRPRFLPFMSGGGGHVTAGGAMCMELLTNTGWSPVSSLESVLLQVRLAICSTDPKPARLESADSSLKQRDYGVGEAFEAYKRAAATHRWEVPKDFFEALSTTGY
ncbi:ubiquitin-conjugating enzyme E2 Q [Microdochium nivale]|nr:ubiquitin-conjugating enzyme E2 Q [Microdochium nivale]